MGGERRQRVRRKRAINLALNLRQCHLSAATSHGGVSRRRLTAASLGEVSRRRLSAAAQSVISAMSAARRQRRDVGRVMSAATKRDAAPNPLKR